MPRDDLIEIDGTVLAAKGGGFYDVQPTIPGGKILRVKLCGKMKQKHIQVLAGDKVTVGVSPYDPSNGIITWRVR
jgi:translation initiation factor IF-1